MSRAGYRPRRGRTKSRVRRIADYGLAFAILGLLALLAARLDRVGIRTALGSAIVNDGDTLTLASEKIRLKGIDAPEFSQLCRRDGADYACGRLSRDSLRGLIASRQVDCTGWEHDRYGRLLATCEVAGRSLNAAQVEAGWAVAYGGYDSEEADARRRGVGIWAGTFDRPKDWRDSHGDMADVEHDWLGSVLNWLRQMMRGREENTPGN